MTSSHPSAFRGLLFSLLLCAPAAFPSTIKQLSVGEMLRTCELVFEGQVISVYAQLEGNRGDIVSHVTFQIKEVLKGQSSGRYLELTFLGGTVRDRSLVVEDLHLPELNEHGIYFVRSTREKLMNPLCGWDQGHFLVTRDAGNAERIKTRIGKEVADVTEGTPAQIEVSAGIATGISTAASPTRRMSADDFKTKLRRMAEAVRTK
jgi:hypothetical protein